MCDIRGYGRVSCPRDDLISTLANLSPQLFRGHPAVRNSLIDWGDPPSSLETKVGDSPSIGELWLCLRPHRPSRQEGASPVKPPENKSIPSSSSGTFGASRTWWSASTTHPWTMITTISGPFFLPLLHGRLGSRDGENERLVKMKGDGEGAGRTRNANGMRAGSGGLM